nr:hypothetical protein [Candidatus Sigynarchaeota archaeon]
RQGDVLLVEVDEIPKRAKQLQTKIILEGEATGHAHRIVHGEIFQEFTDMFVDAGDGTKLVHDEHGPIKLEPGIYKVVRQAEYDPNRTKRRGAWVLD